MSEGAIVLMGAGTVAKRDADLLSSLFPGRHIYLVKHDVKYPEHIAKSIQQDVRGKNPNISQDEIEQLTTWKKGEPVDVRTKELKQLFAWHPDRLGLYVAAGKPSTLESRIQRLESNGLPVQGVVYHPAVFESEAFKDDARRKKLVLLDKVALAIDASPTGIDKRNVDEFYKPKNWAFCLNGGADGKIVNNRYFAGILGTTADYNCDEFKNENSMIVSCNTHAATTILALLQQTIAPISAGRENSDSTFRSLVRDINITFLRRHEDPHTGKAKPEYLEIEARQKHVAEMEYLLPAAQGLITTEISKTAAEYFHTVLLEVNFHCPVYEKWVEKFRENVDNYPRTILVKGGISHEKTILAAGWSRLYDGDIPFPVCSIDTRGKYQIKVLMLTPQRGIVAPSTADIALLRLGKAETLQDAFAYTNEYGVYRKIPLRAIKNGVQDNLQNFNDRKEKPGNSTKVENYIGIRIDGKLL